MKNRYKKLFDLSGKVAIITGSSRGIGASIAEALAEFGASVVVSSRSQESIDKVANKIIENGFDATTCACHVFDRLENADEKLFNKIMDINVKAAFKLSNMAMKHMKNNKSGSIINISSVEGHKPDKGLGVYSISKAAISMLTKSQAKEWGKYGIRSNAICPGLIKTKLIIYLLQPNINLR